MAFGFARNRFSPIAIDPGADQLKLLQIVGSDPPTLGAMAAEPVPESARGEEEARQAFLEEALPRLLQQGGFRGRRAMCTIPAPQTFVHHVDIAANEKISQEDQLNSQLRERLNLEPTRLVVRSFDVGPIQREAGQFRRLVCLAARRDLVMQYVELARRCRLEVAGIHSEPLCLVRAFSHLSRRSEDTRRVWCYIDLGAATTKVAIARGGEMVFTKTILAGGHQAVQATARARSISFEQARRMHIAEIGGQAITSAHGEAAHADAGVAVTGGNAAAATAVQPDAGEAAPFSPEPSDASPFDRTVRASGDTDLDTEAYETVLDELRLCLRYHRRVFPDCPVEKLVFVGGEAPRRDRCIALAKHVGLPAQMGDPLAQLSAGGEGAVLGVDPSLPQPGWAVPVGLSLSDANL